MINELSKIEARNILNADLNTFLDFIKEINHNRSNEITFSKNIFLPLTHICQNNCGYCTFKQDVDEVEYLVMLLLEFSSVSYQFLADFPVDQRLTSEEIDLQMLSAA